jgi:hypothetical protein
MNNQTLKRLSWLALALAILGIVETPALITSVIAASRGSQNIIGPLFALGIRFLVIGAMLTLWWKWRNLPTPSR